jgi:hypothetical protein
MPIEEKSFQTDEGSILSLSPLLTSLFVPFLTLQANLWRILHSTYFQDYPYVTVS